MIHKVCNTKETQLLQKLIIEDAIASMEEYPSENIDGLLTETGIVLGKENYGGQVVILAGGAGSGKSYVKNNLLLLRGKTFDLDEIKRLIINNPKTTLHASFQEYFKKRLEDMSSETIINDAAVLHNFKIFVEKNQKIKLNSTKDIKLYAQSHLDIFKDFVRKFKATYQTPDGYKMGNQTDIFVSNALNTFAKQKNEEGDNLLRRAISDFFKKVNPNLLPNIVFDRTLKDADDVSEIAQLVLAVGYKPENIHIIWVLTPVSVAQENNEKRDRKVVPEALEETHTQVAKNMYNLLIENPVFIRQNGIDGEFMIVFNNRKANDISKIEKRLIGSLKNPFYINEYRHIIAKKRNDSIQKLSPQEVQSIREYAPNFQ